MVNVFTRSIERVSVGVFGGRICFVGAEEIEAAETVDLDGRVLAPGFIDAHMHVESTMMMPREFVGVAAPHGTTGVVFDPHEIANVLGLAGIRLLMDASEGLPMNIMFGASSCVPSSRFETSGAELSARDLEPLFEDPRVVAMAEMMNFPGVVSGESGVLEKVRLGLERGVVDGHCPGLSGRALGAYAGAGISSDHECTTAEEALERVGLGMMVYVREGSAARNLEALLPAIDDRNAARFCFCTDDRHPGDLREDGHVDHAVRKAVSLDLDPATAIAMASLHVAQHYSQPDLGAIAPGRQADLIVFDGLERLVPERVYHRGALVASGGEIVDGSLGEPTAVSPSLGRDSVVLPAGFDESSLQIEAEPDCQRIRVIMADPHQLWTGQRHVEPCVVDGRYEADPRRELLKLAVIARHGSASGGGSGDGRKGEGIGLGFVTGFGYFEGALASTVGHDAHNLAVVGSNDRDMAVAAEALAACGGGQCVVKGGEVRAVLPLPIAGLLSDQAAADVIEAQRALLDASGAIGCPLHDPFMPLSFLPLPVIPELKLTDRGLVDVIKQEIVPLGVR